MTREFQLYIVPTPIGNLKDITLRALEVLKSVDVIACEDTRTTQKLLNHYDITTKCYSYHKYNEKERLNFFKSVITEGKSVALVSDAGTPLICDPGAVLLEELLKNGIKVTALPGACAVTTFVSQVPRENEAFTFVGFIPRTVDGIKKIVNNNIDKYLVFYESPERILKTLEVIKSARGDIKIAIGRELSKLFEEIKISTISELQEYFKDGIKGEIVCMIYPSLNINKDELINRIRVLKSKGFKAKDISIILSSLFNENKNMIYDMAINID